MLPELVLTVCVTVLPLGVEPQAAGSEEVLTDNAVAVLNLPELFSALTVYVYFVDAVRPLSV